MKVPFGVQLLQILVTITDNATNEKVEKTCIRTGQPAGANDPTTESDFSDAISQTESGKTVTVEITKNHVTTVERSYTPTGGDEFKDNLGNAYTQIEN